MTATEDLTTPPPSLIATVARAGQQQVFRFWDRLDAAARAQLIRQLEAVDWDGLPALQALVAEHRRGVAAAVIGDLSAALRFSSIYSVTPRKIIKAMKNKFDLV